MLSEVKFPTERYVRDHFISHIFKALLFRGKYFSIHGVFQFTELGVCQKNPPSSCFCENLPKLLKHLNVSWIGGLLESSAQNSCKSLYT